MSIADAIATITKKLAGKATPTPQLDQQFEVALPQLKGKYMLRVTPVSFGKGYWNNLVVEILDAAAKNKLGEYTRNYSTLYKTFTPFSKNGKDYALYSKDYTSTRVMSLPDCVDVGGEDPHGFGFCPTEFYVPQPDDVKDEDDDEANLALDGSFGFIAGCVWGDDSSWKIQYLDLSKIEEGIVKREARFGYIELPNDCKLKDAIGLDWYGEGSSKSVTIKAEIRFDARRSVPIDFSSLTYNEYEKQRNEEDPSRIAKCKNCTHAGRDHCEMKDGKRLCIVAVIGEANGNKNDASKYHRCDCDNFEPTDEIEED